MKQLGKVVFDVVEEVTMHVIVVLLKHLVELYQESLMKKENNHEENFIFENQVDIMQLDVANFFAHPEDKIDNLIGYESVTMEELFSSY